MAVEGIVFDEKIVGLKLVFVVCFYCIRTASFTINCFMFSVVII